MSDRKLRVVRYLVLVLLSCLCLADPAFAAEATPAVSKGTALYVATTGKDSNSGTEKKPFATLQRARDEVRKIKKKEGLTQPITVYIRGGKYFMEETLQLGAEDGGTSLSAITYCAYPGEKPILSGGRVFTKWKPWKDNILQCDVPFAKGAKFHYRQLFVNGKRQVRARYPNYDPSDPLYGGWAKIEKPVAEDNFADFHYVEGTFPHHWAKPTQGEINVFPGNNWLNDIIPIKSVDEKERIIRMTHTTRNGKLAIPGMHPDPIIPPIASWWGTPMNCPLSKGCRYVVENMREDIDQPGEWCIDTEEGRAYFWPAEPLKGAEVVIPYLDGLIDLSGVSNVTISGLTFTETGAGDNFNHSSGTSFGAMFPMINQKYAGDTVHLIEARQCIIEKCTFDQVGGNGVYLEGYNWRNVIRRNTITGSGACGVALVGSKEKHPLFTQVEDNDLSHTGWYNKYSAAIFLGMSEANFVRHNRIQHVPHHAVNLGSNSYGRNFIEYNDIRYAAEETHDNGAINTWMEGDRNECTELTERSGHFIRYNLIRDTPGNTPEYRRFLGEGWKYVWTCGIYLDGLSSNCFVYGNIVARTQVAVDTHCGKNNVIENNILVDNRWGWSPHEYYIPFGAGFLANNTFTRNIVYFTGPRNRPYRLHAFTDRAVAEADYNLFYKIGLDDEAFSYDNDERGDFNTLREWNAMGYDTHSVLADPMFVDAANDDFRLKPESPAFALGFQPIDMSTVGIRPEK